VPIDIPIGSEGALMAEINIRISELETQIRQMTGQLEEANFKVNNLTRKLETLEKDNEFRFRELESGARPMASMPSLGAGSLPSVNTATPAALTAKQKYEQAYGLVSNANYVEAEIGFLEFLEQYPEDALSGNAQYWLGQTYYARGNYADATRTFLEGMSKYPDSSKAPAYLKSACRLIYSARKPKLVKCFVNLVLASRIALKAHAFARPKKEKQDAVKRG
jgi:tol-pal system protein YbgF